MRQKCPTSCSPRIVLENDSHRPEYVTTTVNKSRKITTHDSLKTPELQVKERDVARTLWAIRRTEIGSKGTCFGFLSDTKARCGQLINKDGAKSNIGRPAPSFWGRRSFPSVARGNGGIREGFIWFCATSVTQSWNVDTTWIIAPPGHAPGVWPVERGTNLTNEEKCNLHACNSVPSTYESRTRFVVRSLERFIEIDREEIAEHLEIKDLVVFSDEEEPTEEKKPLQSVLDLIRFGQSKGSSLHVALQSALKTFLVDELPPQYDGYVAYELPPSDDLSSMVGMEHRFDGHVWADYVT
ncbi:hypothetical protein L7F22_017796, partial [Adiantum nelumboides]|nr:hypothetical protein [Adiantum nelumboides]